MNAQQSLNCNNPSICNIDFNRIFSFSQDYLLVINFRKIALKLKSAIAEGVALALPLTKSMRPSRRTIRRATLTFMYLLGLMIIVLQLRSLF